MARIQYQGNWNPEPAGWKRLAAILLNSGKLKLDIDTVELGKGDLSGYRFAHLTGTAAVKFSQPELDAIKAYVNGGGTLLIDAAGGSDDFAAAITDELRTLFPAELAGQQDIPLLDKTDLLYTTGGDLKVEYRRFTRRIGKYAEQWHVPHLRAITVNHRNAIYFSDEDLSAGLVGATADGINGYEPESAVELTARILMSVVNGSAGPAK